MHAFRSPLALLLLTLCLAIPIAAQEGSDDSGSGEAALFLLLPVGAKAVALGRAVTAP